MAVAQLTPKQRTTLRKFLVDRFSETELRNLASDLAIPYERLPHNTTDAFVIALIQRCQNDEMLPDLIERALDIRKDEEMTQILHHSNKPSPSNEVATFNHKEGIPITAISKDIKKQSQNPPLLKLLLWLGVAATVLIFFVSLLAFRQN